EAEAVGRVDRMSPRGYSLSAFGGSTYRAVGMVSSAGRGTPEKPDRIIAKSGICSDHTESFLWLRLDSNRFTTSYGFDGCDFDSAARRCQPIGSTRRRNPPRGSRSNRGAAR